MATQTSPGGICSERQKGPVLQCKGEISNECNRAIFSLEEKEEKTRQKCLKSRKRKTKRNLCSL